MNIAKIAWLTDIHLNFLESTERKQFYEEIAASEPDAILITGDIAEAPNLCSYLLEFHRSLNKPLYFVLGNHDYYRGSVANVRHEIRQLCLQNSHLHWLSTPDIVTLNDHTVLVGIDAWADARFGDFENSPVSMNDSWLIAELYTAYMSGKSSLKEEMQKLADQDAAVLEHTLTKALKPPLKKVIIATHIPPFKECCWYKNKPSDKDWLPFFSSKVTGDVILPIATQHQEIDFLVLCGHTHTEKTIHLLKNLEIRVGHAHYYRPVLQEIIALSSD
jgi:predicted phosphohydrolase